MRLWGRWDVWGGVLWNSLPPAILPSFWDFNFFKREVPKHFSPCFMFGLFSLFFMIARRWHKLQFLQWRCTPFTDPSTLREYRIVIWRYQLRNRWDHWRNIRSRGGGGARGDRFSYIVRPSLRSSLIVTTLSVLWNDEGRSECVMRGRRNTSADCR